MTTSAANDKRLFIGIPISFESSLEGALKKLRIGAQKREMEVNWVPPANFHVTLSFLGATEEERVAGVAEVIARVAAETAPLETSLRGLGGFPDERHARVVWVGVRKSRALGELQSRLREALLADGYPQEEREYVPHLTIGRMRKARAIGDLISPFVRTSFGDSRIENVILYESVMHGASPVYVPLAQVALTGEPLPD